MKFEQLYYFKEAVKYSSISVAAEKNYLSQSSISHAIINLEKNLGVELLKRTTSGVIPTLVGESVLEKTEEIFKAIDEIVQLSQKHSHSGEICLSCIPCLCDWIIPTTIKHLKKQDTDVLLTVSTAESRTVAQNVSSGISEFGVLINYPELEQNSDLKYTPLFKDEYILYVSKFSNHWDKKEITYKEFLNEPYIAYRDEFRKYNGGLTNMFSEISLPNIIFRTDNLDSIKSMITQNNYVAFFPKFMSKDDIFVKNGLIRALPVTDMQLVFEVGYVESTKYKPKKIDKIVLEQIKSVITSHLR